MDFKFPDTLEDSTTIPFDEEIRFLIKELPIPVEWAKEHFKLTTSYAHPGDFYPYPWQVEIINSIVKYDTIILCGPTRTFKSLGSEIMAAYCIDNIPMNAMFCYSKKEVVEQVFDERIRPLIQEVPAIRKYWSGTEKDLTKKKIKLMHLYMRVASAEVKSDIATFGAGLIYASEVSKYRIKPGWSPIDALKRRQEDYRIFGKTKAIFESSPLFEGDCLDVEMKRSGILNLRPYMPCPLCGSYQVLVDRQINERPRKDGKKDHDSNRIMEEQAAYYECLYCHKEIPEEARIEMGSLEKIRWAAANEKIDKKGNIHGRKEKTGVSFQWNRLIDHSFTFHECLARFFEAKKKGKEAEQIYWNEDMGEFWKTRTKRISNEYLRSKTISYSQRKHNDIPNDVLILLLGADAQDNGFYFVINGYGRNMNQYLIMADFVECKINETGGGNQEKDPRQVSYERFQNAVYSKPFIRQDGKKLDLMFGLMDRGGHRPKDVDYICEHMPEMHAYIGLARPDFKKSIIYQSDNGEFYLGQSVLLSQEVGRILLSSKYHLPNDIQESYLEQVLNEYMEDTTDRFGNKKSVYVKKEPNHYRSCENYCYAATRLEIFGDGDLKQMLFDESSIAELEREQSNENKEKDPGYDSNYFNSLKRW